MFTILPLQHGLDNVSGFFTQGISAGFKPNGKEDIAFIRSKNLCNISAVFTTNVFQAAPIKHYLRYPKGFQTNFILMNAKNANAMTGAKGIEDIDTLFEKLKPLVPTTLHNPIMSSTGVIGYRLNVDKLALGLEKFDFNAKNSHSTASAIMTTDSFKKEICLKVELDNGEFFHIAAICKGAGMINPAMATMLCFILTDANIPKEDMDELLPQAVESSFNAVSVDGDTSTNDTVLLLSSKEHGYEKEAFKEALNLLTKELSLMLVRDGEGATKVVAFEVSGAKSFEEAQKAAKALSNSLLVKTALFGEDPNWGRIASTIGASGITCNEETLVIHYDNVLIYTASKRSLDAETELKAAAVMKKDSFKIHCELGIGDFSFTAYGCDLGHEYVKINADYRT